MYVSNVYVYVHVHVCMYALCDLLAPLQGLRCYPLSKYSKAK